MNISRGPTDAVSRENARVQRKMQRLADIERQIQSQLDASEKESRDSKCRQLAAAVERFIECEHSTGAPVAMDPHFISTVHDNFGECVVYIDASQIVRYTNALFALNFSSSNAKGVGLPFLHAVTPQTAAALQPLLHSVFSTAATDACAFENVNSKNGNSSSVFECEICTRTRALLPEKTMVVQIVPHRGSQTGVSPVASCTGQPCSLLGATLVFVDITHKKQLQQSLVSASPLRVSVAVAGDRMPKRSPTAPRRVASVCSPPASTADAAESSRVRAVAVPPPHSPPPQRRQGGAGGAADSDRDELGLGADELGSDELGSDELGSGAEVLARGRTARRDALAWSGDRGDSPPSPSPSPSPSPGGRELKCRFNAKGVLTFANDAYCAFFQSSARELEGTSFLALLSAEDRDRTQLLLDELAKEATFGLEFGPSQSRTQLHHEHLRDGVTRCLRWSIKFMLGRIIMRCDAIRYDAMQCDAMQCDAMRCDAMRCDAMRCDACAPVFVNPFEYMSCLSHLVVPSCDSFNSQMQDMATISLQLGSNLWPNK